MKTIRIIIRALLVLIIFLLIGGVFLIRNVSRKALPDYNADVSLSGLTGTVDVHRDEFGIPHVYADNELDLYRVTGYLQAQDRLWQMDLLRRVTMGRLSEIFGEDMVGADQLFRSLRIPEKSKILIENADPFVMDCLNAYSDGINQFIDENSGKLPFEFTVLGYDPEPWNPIHTFNLIGYMSWELKTGWGIESLLYKISKVVDKEHLMEFIPDLELQDAIFPDFMIERDMEFSHNLLQESAVTKDLGLEVFQASNNWVVDGEHSSTGKPIVCNDMHQGGLDMAPGIWYQMNQEVPGKLHVAGVVLPGTPFVICGHTDSLAWGMTKMTNDDVDFYLETIDPNDSTRYMLDGEWRKMKVVEEKIMIKGGEMVTRTNYFTHRGPVVSSFKGIEDRVISMRWIGNEPSDELRTIFLLNRAGNRNDFVDAVKTFVAISQNIIFGDVNGDIGLYSCGGVPLRTGTHSFIMPGDTSLYDWKGILPFEKLPHAVNPEKGFLVSANNRTTSSDFPYHLSHWFDLPIRYNRIHELLSERDVLTPDDMEAIQVDDISLWALEFMPVIRAELDMADLEGKAKSMYEVLRDWNGKMGADLIAPSIFEAFYLKLMESVFLDELGEELYYEFIWEQTLLKIAFNAHLKGQPLSWADNVKTEESEKLEDLIIPSWEATADWLSSKYGEDMEDWKWGNIHQISFTHALGSVNILKKVFNLERGPFGIGGGDQTVIRYKYDLRDPFNTYHGSAQRHVFSTADWDDSRVIIPTGISGIPASDFFCNQSEMYVRNEYMNELFSKEKVLENTVFKATFTGK